MLKVLNMQQFQTVPCDGDDGDEIKKEPASELENFIIKVTFH
jgi:hypothetical protein